MSSSLLPQAPRLRFPISLSNPHYPRPPYTYRHWIRSYSYNKSSISQGPFEPPLLEDTIGQQFSKIVRRYGDRNALISHHQSARLSYSVLDVQSTRLARGLREQLGVGKGERVAVSLGNCVEFVLATYALVKLGAILVPLNPAFSVQQVTSALKHLDASHLIVSAETNLPFKKPRSNRPLLEHVLPDVEAIRVFSDVVPSLRGLVVVDNASSSPTSSLPFRALTPFTSLLEDQPSTALSEEVISNQDIASIQFTSGTTSAPKAACLSHRSILNNGFSIGARMLLTPADVIICPPPLFHCFGSVLGLMASVTHGASIVFPAEAFEPVASLKSVQAERGTALYGVPTMFVSMLEAISKGKVASTGFEALRTGIAAGSSVPRELMRRLRRELGLEGLTICYGMTETSPVSYMTTTDDPIEKRVGSVGRLLPHVRAKIVDIGSDRQERVVGVGERGELAVSGYLVMQKYWGDEDKTKEALREDDGGALWMYTGDEAVMDNEGYVTITGRIKDLIIRGGENIHPLEVENCLFTMPGVEEVSVVGLPDEKYGEVVAAFVVQGGDEGKKVTEDQVKLWVKQRLGHHLVPRHVFFVDTYPKTASGKIQKFKLREMGDSILAG